MNGKVGPESDQYALGVLLYVCLTNRLPFEEHQNLSLLRAIEAGRFPSPRVYRPELPETLEAVVLRAMHATAGSGSNRCTRWGKRCGHSPAHAGRSSGRTTISTRCRRSLRTRRRRRSLPPRSMPSDRQILPTPDGTPGLTTPQSPQMMVSTRLAKSTPPRADGARELPDSLAAFRSKRPSRACRVDVGTSGRASR